MGKNLVGKKTIVIKGDDSKCYDEVIFVMKNKTPDLFLADKIINKYKDENIMRVRIFFECVFYCILIILIIVISVKILMLI